LGENPDLGLLPPWFYWLNPYLVGGIPTPLKNMSSSDWIIIPTIGENNKCSKPPTRVGFSGGVMVILW
jgi:hypothetical protein